MEKKLSPDRGTDMHTKTHTSLALLLLSGQVYSGSHEEQMEEERGNLQRGVFYTGEVT